MKPIRTEMDYQQALTRLEEIFDAKPGTPEFDELEVLGILIDAYEAQHHAIEMPDPIEAIKFRMEQLGYRQTDLVPAIGLKSRVSEILNKKRKLTVEMIRSLSTLLSIPAHVLVQDYQLR